MHLRKYHVFRILAIIGFFILIGLGVGTIWNVGLRWLIVIFDAHDNPTSHTLIGTMIIVSIMIIFSLGPILSAIIGWTNGARHTNTRISAFISGFGSAIGFILMVIATLLILTSAIDDGNSGAGSFGPASLMKQIVLTSIPTLIVGIISGYISGKNFEYDTPNIDDPRNSRVSILIISITVLVLIIGGLFGGPLTGTGTVVASHDTENNWIVNPDKAPQDRQPNAENTDYKHFATGGDSLDRGFQNLNFIVLESDVGSFANCNQENFRTLGIDRGDTNSGIDEDESLFPHLKAGLFSEDKLIAEFYDKDDPIGSSTYFNKSDQLLAHYVDCFNNPTEPGWYQMNAIVNGTDWNGEYRQIKTTSHWFWICDCRSEEEARSHIGKPPSETSSKNLNSSEEIKNKSKYNKEKSPTGTMNKAGSDTKSDSGLHEPNSSSPNPMREDGSNNTNENSTGESITEDSTPELTVTNENGRGFGIAAGIIAYFAIITIVMKD